MPPHNRASAVIITETNQAVVWVDYNARNQIIGLTVVNDGPGNVYAEATTTKGATFSRTFPAGTTTVNIPPNAGITVGFDAVTGQPYLNGLTAYRMTDPA